jgi:hypothetical protein
MVYQQSIPTKLVNKIKLKAEIVFNMNIKFKFYLSLITKALCVPLSPNKLNANFAEF